MTEREISVLRDRVARVKLAHERTRRDNLAPSRLLPRSARCVYCGARTKARHLVACTKHRDLLALDPKYVALSFLGGKAPA